MTMGSVMIAVVEPVTATTPGSRHTQRASGVPDYHSSTTVITSIKSTDKAGKGRLS
jgi:hypothetical protein